MIQALGATVGGKALTQALGYPSQEAFRKARKRGQLPVLTFEMEGRRGRFASATDIAAWLWRQRHPSTPIDQGVDGKVKPDDRPRYKETPLMKT